MEKLIDYAGITTTRGMFSAHLFNVRLLVSSAKLIAKEAKKRYSSKEERFRLELLRECTDTITLAKRHQVSVHNPFNTHKGKQYGIVRGKVVFVEHFEGAI